MNITHVGHGGVTSAQGFAAGGIHAGLRKNPRRLDLALVEADSPCTTAMTATKNKFAAAPVQLDRQALGTPSVGTAQAILINSGIANAATGQEGLENAAKIRKLTADTIGCCEDDVLVASTGVIGEQLNVAPFATGVPKLQKTISADQKGGHDAACAIMTTDTHPKEFAVSYSDSGLDTTITVGGMVKGSGMIQPNMATMIAVITTDLPMSEGAAYQALAEAVGHSFNKVTVDSDTSTNDTCVLMASGEACPKNTVPIEANSKSYAQFAQALDQVTQHLAREIAADGEGSTKLVTVNVYGAANDQDADKAARAVANSPLVKTAIAGRDANWGRIAGALGKSGAAFDSSKVDIDMMSIPVMWSGMAVEFDEDKVAKAFEDPEIVLDINLRAGSASTTVWTCDLTHGYITINADYRS